MFEKRHKLTVERTIDFRECSRLGVNAGRKYMYKLYLVYVYVLR